VVVLVVVFSVRIVVSALCMDAVFCGGCALPFVVFESLVHLL
jgi:hypothetical protein